MRPTNASYPDVPAAVADALALVTNPQLAAQADPQKRQIALFIVASALGRRPRQAHRPANTSGRPRQ